MKKLLLLLPIAFICASLPSDETLTTTNIFAIDLYKSLVQNNSNNLVFSPYSISQAMAMTYDGAANETKAQMQEVLGFSANKSEIGITFQQMNTSLQQSSDSVNLSIANGLWAQKDYRFLKSYINTSKQNYNAQVKAFNFKKEKTRNKATAAINKWVSKHTNSNIENMLEPSDLNELTRMVLTNAIWFKADWKFGFNLEETQPFAFENLNGKKVETLLMHQDNKLPYYDNKQLQALKLPYANSRFSLIVLLPKTTANFNKLEEELSWRNLSTINKKLLPAQVDVKLPKFKLESSLQLGETLQRMGMTIPFSNSADFSGMTGNKELKIDKVIHKATIDVSEKGTEASAATAVIMIRKTAFIPPIKFIANRPFVYCVFDEATQQILFIGRYVQAD